MSSISIKGLDKAAVLLALYNRAKPQGMGFFQSSPEPMKIEEARKILEEAGDGSFDYLDGRVMKVDIAGDELEPRLYDRDNGGNAAESALKSAGLI